MCGPLPLALHIPENVNIEILSGKGASLLTHQEFFLQQNQPRCILLSVYHDFRFFTTGQNREFP